MDIKDVVIQAVRKYNKDEKYWQTVDADTLLRGDKSPLDSLAFVGLMVAVEREIEQATGKDVQIFKPEYFLGKSVNPYKTVGSLIDLAVSIIGSCEDGSILNRFPHQVKIIFTDLDGTLWTGISGEGKVKIILRIWDAIVRLLDAGILFVLVTKNYRDIVCNEMKDIVEFFDRRFVACKYNVADKAATIREVCETLNLGLDSAVFLDDDVHERDRVKTALPMIWVPENHMDIAKIETGAVTEEDRNRTAMYKQEYERAKSKPHSDSTYDYMAWLASLDMVLTIKKAETKEEIDRANELIERTNQFNFGKDEINGRWDTFVISLKDKFGDMGIISTVNTSYSLDAQCTYAYNFCVSCRVLFRGVENTIYQLLKKYVVKLAPPIDSGKNKAAMDFWRVAQHNNTKYPIKVIEA